MVVLPQAMAYGVALFTLAGTDAASGALAGLIGAACLSLISGLIGGAVGVISAPTGPALVLLAGTLAALTDAGVSGERLAGALAGVIVLAGLLGWWLLPAPGTSITTATRVPIGKGLAIGSLAVFFGLLVGLPVLREVAPNQALAVFDSFFRAGSLVFGGGHVVLPLLQAEVVPPGWVTNEEFVAGYGAAQAVPGPLFTFAAYLGAVMHQPPNGWAGAGLALAAVFLPSFLLIVGGLPFWELLRRRASFQAALRGINAAVVGLLVAALYDPVWTSAIKGPADFALALVAFGLLMFWRLAPWLVVVLTALAAGRVRSCPAHSAYFSRRPR